MSGDGWGRSEWTSGAGARRPSGQGRGVLLVLTPVSLGILGWGPKGRGASVA